MGGKNFTVYPNDGEHLDLETGEFFENPQYAKSRKHLDKLIYGHLSVHEASSEADMANNKMSYSEEIKGADYYSPPSIFLTYFLHPHHFQVILKNIQSGILPTTVQINLPYKLSDKPSPIKFGWEPDGSGTEWRNKDEDNRQVPIESIGFHYEVLKGIADPDTHTLSKLEHNLKEIQKEVKYIGWIIIGAAIFLAFFLSRH